jgi:heme-degrading monooxygenase HmoA
VVSERGSVPWPQMSYITQVFAVIVQTMKITVLPEKRIELAQTIERLLRRIQDIKGFRTFRFYLDVVDENSALLVSEWETESACLTYLRSNDFAILRGAIKVLSDRGVGSNALLPFSVIASEQTWLKQQADQEIVHTGRFEEV